MSAIAIIGTNYGDEGKGLATDYFTRVYGASIVARMNGGAQAGHTVVDYMKDRRHVFGHIGAGSFAGAHTYLSEAFIVNPRVLSNEQKKMKFKKQVMAHPHCRVSTIFDMAINSLVELKRGDGRHGSCGLGINETVTRNKAGYFLSLQDLAEARLNRVTDLLTIIRDHWVPARLAELKISKDDFTSSSEAVKNRVELYFSMFATDTQTLAKEMIGDVITHIMVKDPRSVLMPESPVIIEGAQGLMLDEYLGTFPHVTRSITGLPSAIKAAAECGKTTVHPVYMTRAYTTRHGAGFLPSAGYEITDNPDHLIDQTNIHNDWQGTMRFAPLHLPAMLHYITADLYRSKPVAELFGVEVAEPTLFITCMDQLGSFVNVIDLNGLVKKLKPEELKQFVEDSLGITVSHTAHGPTAKSVQVHKLVL